MSEEQIGSGKSIDRNSMLSISIGLLVSAIFFMTPLLFICLIPLQWVYHKTGPSAGTKSSLIAMVLMVGAQLVIYRLMFGQLTMAAAFDVALPIALVAGLMILNLRWKGKGIVAWLRIILVYFVIFVIMSPTVENMFGNSELRSQFEAMISATATSFGMPTIEKTTLDLFLELSIRLVPLLLTVLVLFNWYVTTWFWRRRSLQWSASSALANFRIAEYMVWPLLFGLAVFAASLVVKLPLLVERLSAMVSLGMILLYLLQGLGIIAAFLARRRNPISRPLPLPLVCAILFLTPLSTVAMVVVPLLGVLEIWVRMRPVTHANVAP